MELTPEVILAAYAQGYFPMGEDADSETLHWFEPQRRGVMPLGGFRVSRSLLRTRRRGRFRFSCDRDFAGVMAGCAARDETWINPPIREVFMALHDQGLAHSVEVHEKGRLVGGVYGLAMGGAFFAESMFSRRTDGSKLALAELVARLKGAGFTLMDTQYLTPHLASLGGVEVSHAVYRGLLARALALAADHARAFAPENPLAGDGAFWEAA